MNVRRNLKNVVYNFSEYTRKAREATSNDPWGPSTTQMQEIADLTYNMAAYADIMPIVWKRLNDNGKNWRHVYKSLLLLDYLVRYGSKRIAQQCKENIFVIQTLQDFQYIEVNRDLGSNVRERAKQLVALLNDEVRLKNERAKADALRHRIPQEYSSKPDTEIFQRARHASTSYPTYDNTMVYQYTSDPVVAAEYAAPDNVEEEALQVQLALAISKEEAEEDDKRRKKDSIKLSLAVSESLKNNEENLSDLTMMQNSGKNASENDLLGMLDFASPDQRNNINKESLMANRPVSANPWINQPTNSHFETRDPWGSASTPRTPLTSQFDDDLLMRTKASEMDKSKNSFDYYNLMGDSPMANTRAQDKNVANSMKSSPGINQPRNSHFGTRDPWGLLSTPCVPRTSQFDDDLMMINLQNAQSNPFATSSMNSTQPVSNPFLESTVKPPTLNELSSNLPLKNIPNNEKVQHGTLPHPLIPVDAPSLSKSSYQNFNPF